MSGERRAVRVLIVAATGIAIILAGVFLANLSIGSGLDNWDKVGSFFASVAVASLALLAGVFFSGFASERLRSAERDLERSKEDLAYSLIRSFFAAIEKAGQKKLAGDGKIASRPISLRDVADIMLSHGVWSEQDRIGFDLARRARNSIVHGDLEEVDIVDLKYANEKKVNQLLRKINESQAEGSA